LARAGFDVWMGNNRGNIYSMSHIKYSPKEKEFWDFEFEQMGTYDQPAQINYILENTKAEKLAAYIGHSEGTT
jgi:predicted alpha/beta hydrolase